MRRKVVYVASPLAGDVDANIAFAKRASTFVAKSGVTPYIPHLTFPAITNDNIPKERAFGIMMNKDILSRCDELWVFSENGISAGMAIEMEEAKQLGIPIRVFENLTELENIGLPENLIKLEAVCRYAVNGKCTLTDNSDNTHCHAAPQET